MKNAILFFSSYDNEKQGKGKVMQKTHCFPNYIHGPSSLLTFSSRDPLKQIFYTGLTLLHYSYINDMADTKRQIIRLQVPRHLNQAESEARTLP